MAKLPLLPHRIRVGLSVTAGAVLGILVLALLSQVAFADRIYPGVTVGSVNLSNLTISQAQSALTASEQSLASRGILVSVGEEKMTVRPEDLGANFDAAASAEAAFKIGHRLNFLAALQERLSSLLVQTEVLAVVTYDPDKLTAVTSGLAQKVDHPAKDAGIAISGTTVTITPSSVGTRLDQEAVKAAIISKLTELEATPLSFPVTTDYPKVYEEDARAAQAQAQQALSGAVQLTWRGKTWSLDAGKIAGLLSFSPADHPAAVASITVGGQSFHLGQVRFIPHGQGVGSRSMLTLGLDQTKLNAYVDTLAQAIDQTAVDAKFLYQGGKLSSFAVEQEGREVDRENLAARVISELTDSGPRVVEIPVKVSEPAVTLAQVNNLGIKELLGRGVSRYTGSSYARMQNIRIGASRINGTLVPPGEVFSMSQVVGDVSISTGFAVGLIISNGRTEEGVGGGLCQVSTTLFRAALNSGLPIVERYPHAYRVGYYEQNSPAGVDASVYFPTSDFKFKNDTGSYILVQAINDPSTSTLTFEIYGTSDGRQTSLTTPIVSNIIPAPAPLYQDDPTLPKGVVKQVDYSANGATAVFSRTVTRGGQVLHQDTFFTKYQPWQAVFLVGTKEG